MAGPTDVHLELGGKSAMIIFDDVEDLAATVDWACVGIFSNSGQVCRCAPHVFPSPNVYFQTSAHGPSVFPLAVLRNSYISH